MFGTLDGHNCRYIWYRTALVVHLCICYNICYRRRVFLVQLVWVGLAGCRDSFMRRDSGGHGAGTPQWTSSGQWSPSNPTIDAFSPHCATYGHSEECITGTLRQTHPIQRARSKLLKNSEHSNGVNLLSFLSVQRAQGSKL